MSINARNIQLFHHLVIFFLLAKNEIKLREIQKGITTLLHKLNHIKNLQE